MSIVRGSGGFEPWRPLADEATRRRGGGGPGDPRRTQVGRGWYPASSAVGFGGVSTVEGAGGEEKSWRGARRSWIRRLCMLVVSQKTSNISYIRCLFLGDRWGLGLLGKGLEPWRPSVSDLDIDLHTHNQRIPRRLFFSAPSANSAVEIPPSPMKCGASVGGVGRPAPSAGIVGCWFASWQLAAIGARGWNLFGLCYLSIAYAAQRVARASNSIATTAITSAARCWNGGDSAAEFAEGAEQSGR